MNGVVRYAVPLATAWITLTSGTPSQAMGQSVQLPATAGGWTRTDSVSVYAGKNLFLLVNGGADLFFEYGFVRALTAEYSRLSESRAAAELYEMATPSAAYGLFTSFTAGTGTSVPIGQEAVLGEGYCIFWKGSCVGMLTAASVDSSSVRMLLQLAQALERQIPQTGRLPDLCALLREGGLESRTMVYVRGKIALGDHFPHAWSEPLPASEGVVGSSRGSRYLVLQYPDAATASAALHVTVEQWEKMRLPLVRDSGGKWTLQLRTEGIAMLEQQGRYILVVSGGGEEAEDLASLLLRILGR